MPRIQSGYSISKLRGTVSRFVTLGLKFSRLSDTTLLACIFVGMSRKYIKWRTYGFEKAFPQSSKAAVTVGCGLQRHTLWAAPSSVEYGYGPLVLDPEGIFDLPKGFSYQIISRMGDAMDDGLLLPVNPTRWLPLRSQQSHAPMKPRANSWGEKVGAFGEDNQWIDKIPRGEFYDWGRGTDPALGGTTTVVISPEGQVERQFMSLVGTVRNCAGGPTPWGSWITCEPSYSQTICMNRTMDTTSAIGAQ